MAELSKLMEHLLRRASFGATPAERERFARMSYTEAVDELTGFDPSLTSVDAHIGTPGFAGITAPSRFSPNTVINDARQRWVWRMVHSPAPLQERMALIWHHHFATAYSKISGIYGGTEATRMMAAVPSEDTAGVMGQLELLRTYALGNFRDLLIETAKDPAMLVWLDGRLNTRTLPQENYARELMELFTFGVGHFTEPDVYAAARVFTGWNLTQLGVRDTPSAYYAFFYNSAQHDTTAKTFTFPIYTDGGRTIPARSAANGMQDGLDLINALAFHPETARRMARRLWTWFVSEVREPDASFVERIAGVYLESGTEMFHVIRAVLLSPEFRDERHFYERYEWPVEFAVRALKEVGYLGFSVNDTLTPLLNMGQQLFEPPDVNGWDLGPGWFSTAGMLARMNFAATLATNQRFAIREAARPFRASPAGLVQFAADRLSMPPLPPQIFSALQDYVRAGGAWTGSETQLLNKAAGLIHLLVGSGGYQFV